MRSVIRELVSDIAPADDVEHAHRAEVLAWLDGTDDIFRRVEPATPPRHLVTYVAVVDPTREAVFLVDHIKAGRWLPPGGHVEPGEHPAVTARREVQEELGVAAPFDTDTAPLFLTLTTTVNIDSGHEDVSLWYVATAASGTEFVLDPAEFHGGRWWRVEEITVADARRFDPHLHRFLEKLRGADASFPIATPIRTHLD
ncbi:NUDIX hydrolase [Nocardia bovistercoris]|uniref:NUDIX domain-containing protein n=1 Tax=Nocardia bovistercoris TaxID=2785916 RepID=A0A931IH05_9NOCA|nr:NUDIX domain-containing protein [Nocardia bovistercoris]MBH0779493.1 NUDIX domain-containing protein [Nocardia bovistercoris]